MPPRYAAAQLLDGYSGRTGGAGRLRATVSCPGAGSRRLGSSAARRCATVSCGTGGSRNDPTRNRCGCFLPDLTRLATTPSARLPGGHMGKGAASGKRRHWR